MLCVVWVVALLAVAATGAPLITVYQAGENGYSCFRIPDLLVTSSGAVLAFAEARKLSCADNTWIGLGSWCACIMSDVHRRSCGEAQH